MDRSDISVMFTMNETIFVFDMKSQGCKIDMKSLLANDFLEVLFPIIVKMKVS